MKRACLRCGKAFDAAPGTTLCRECAAASKASTHWRDRECRQCGKHFLGGPRAWYCPECRHERKKAAYRRYHRDGPARPLGSTDLCQRCGQPYTVESGTQRYCPKCGPIVLQEIDRAQSRAWNAANIDPAQRTADRRASTGQIKCEICGKLFTPHGPGLSLTCSPECSAELAKRRAEAREKAHRAERTAAAKAARDKRLAAMTPEELAAYRAHTNALQRASYQKRKQRTASSEGQEGDKNDT